MKIPVLALVLLMILTLLLPQSGYTQTYEGKVWLDTVTVEVGGQFGMSIHLSDNDKSIAALMFPIRFDADAFVFDSVGFEGSILTGDYRGFAVAEMSTVQIFYVPNSNGNQVAPIESPNGLMATMFFTALPGAQEGIYTVDSVNHEGRPENPLWQKIHFSDKTGFGTHFPQFVPGIVEIHAVSLGSETDAELPEAFSLEQNYPNPFNPTTTIEFSLPRASYVKLEVYNVLGQLVETLVEGPLPAGRHQADFNASSEPSGVYFYRIAHDEGVLTKKMILVK